MLRLLLVLVIFCPCVISLDLLVPAYFSTDSRGLIEWNRLISTASRLPLTVIINPEEFQEEAGSPDTRLQEIVKSLRARGAKIIGWVDGDIRRDLLDIYTDIDYYLNFYSNLDGIFMDQMADEDTEMVLDYYQEVYAYVKGKSPSLQLIGNPGIPVAESFLEKPLADSFATFEGAQADYGLFYQQNWTEKYDSSQFIHIIYGSTVDQMIEDVKGTV